MLDSDRPLTDIGASALALPMTKDRVVPNTAQHDDGTNTLPTPQFGHPVMAPRR